MFFWAKKNTDRSKVSNDVLCDIASECQRSISS